jgi:hypothetical protein
MNTNRGTPLPERIYEGLLISYTRTIKGREILDNIHITNAVFACVCVGVVAQSVAVGCRLVLKCVVVCRFT